MKKLCLLLALVLIAGPVLSAVKMNTGMTYNIFADTRLSGMNQTTSVAFDVGDMEVAWLFETAALTTADETNGTAGAFLTSANAICLSKSVASALGSKIITGIELGSMTENGLTANRAAPLMGIFGSIGLEGKSKDVVTALKVRVGYRMVDIIDTTLTTGSTVTVKNLNSLGITILASIGF